MSMSFSKWNRIPMGEAALIAIGGGLAAWYSPQLDPLAIVYVVLLARFRGRAQSLIGAFTFSLLMLASALAGSHLAHSHTDLLQLVAVISGICRGRVGYGLTFRWSNALPPLAPPSLSFGAAGVVCPVSHKLCLRQRQNRGNCGCFIPLLTLVLVASEADMAKDVVDPRSRFRPRF